jgi:hypothetical protein
MKTIARKTNAKVVVKNDQKQSRDDREEKKPIKKVSTVYIDPEFKATEEEEIEILKVEDFESVGKSVKEKMEKQSAVKKEKGPSLVSILTPFIEKGNKTKKELMEIGHENLPHLSDSTLSTVLTDCKNPKYNKFEKLVKVTEKGMYQFAQ